MSGTKSLGQIVRDDRERLGLTQEQLSKKLSETDNRPLDPFTKKPKTAHRTWVAKLESGDLKHSPSLEVRQWLCNALGG